jgi:Ca2+-binding RTX toxin-like protein
MARITSSEQFDERTFAFQDIIANRHTTTSYGDAGNYRYGINTYENTMNTLLNGGTSRLMSYHNDMVRNGVGDITGGTVNAVLDQYQFGTRWTSTFALTGINGSGAAYDLALHSVSGADDRTFLYAQLGGADLIQLSRFDDYSNGRDGNDTIRSGYGDDSLFGDVGNDRLDGGSDNDYVYGGVGTDYVMGGRSADFLYGGDDNDTLVGGDGNDLLAGGNGADVFMFNIGDDTDTVTTFTQGLDKLRVAGMTATTAWTAVQDGTSTDLTVKGVHIILQNTLVADMTNADFIF